LTAVVPGASIRIENLTKRFGSVVAVDQVSFNVAAGQFVVLLGPSGSGKTTILRMVAGLEIPDSGRVWFGDHDTTRTPAHKRGVGYVFQRASMFPHYTVRENIAWGLKLRKVPQAEVEQRVAEMIDLVQLDGLEERFATQLSGGQAQRVVIARALAPDPPILLLDEPLSALDAKLRDELKDVIADVQKRTRKTMMMVTHDQREALSLADSVIVMDVGHIAQLGSPAEVYRHPATAFVASFVGNTNLVPGTVAAVQPDRSMTVHALGQELEVPSANGLGPGDQVLLSLRPDDLEVIDGPEHASFRYVFEGQVRNVVFVGGILQMEVAVGDELLRVHAAGRSRFSLMQEAPETVTIGTSELVLIPASA
jgi:ABC-type Fe3+/spermidine/putrescine transport system ATPase subunit